MKILKVAIDSGPTQSRDAIRGIGFHTKELISHLKNLKDVEVNSVDFKTTDLSKYDVVHYPYFHPHFLTLPFTKPSKKVILTIHDLIRLIYPESYPPGIKGQIKFLIQKFNLRNVDEIITISETSKKDIVRFLEIKPEKIHVIYLAPQTYEGKLIDTKIVKQKYNLPDKFVLYVGDVNYNKNILGLAEACKMANVNLVIVGKQATEENFDRNHPENELWVQFLNKFGNDKNVLRVGFIPSEELPAFFELASIYCQPSFYEGFGLPILESFKYECPVVASKIQAHTEIAHDGALFVDPRNPKNMAEGIGRVIKDKKFANELVKKGNVRLKNFSWEKCAKETLEIYRNG